MVFLTSDKGNSRFQNSIWLDPNVSQRWLVITYWNLIIEVEKLGIKKHRTGRRLRRLPLLQERWRMRSTVLYPITPYVRTGRPLGHEKRDPSSSSTALTSLVFEGIQCKSPPLYEVGTENLDLVLGPERRRRVELLSCRPSPGPGSRSGESKGRGRRDRQSLTLRRHPGVDGRLLGRDDTRSTRGVVRSFEFRRSTVR